MTAEPPTLAYLGARGVAREDQLATTNQDVGALIHSTC